MFYVIHMYHQFIIVRVFFFFCFFCYFRLNSINVVLSGSWFESTTSSLNMFETFQILTTIWKWSAHASQFVYPYHCRSPDLSFPSFLCLSMSWLGFCSQTKNINPVGTPFFGDNSPVVWLYLDFNSWQGSKLILIFMTSPSLCK